MAKSASIDKRYYTVKKSDFAGIWSNVMRNYCSKKLVKDSFAKCGIIPLNPAAIDKDKLKPSKRWVQLNVDNNNIQSIKH